MYKDFKNKKGFTIVELLAVVVIIAIITVIAAASVYSVMKKAREKQYETNLDSMKTSVRLFADDAKNGLSALNNALVYKDENGKTWRIGCTKDDSNKRTCCISMSLLKEIGYLKVTEEDMCADYQKCIDYSANIFYSGNSVDAELVYGAETCEVIKYEVIYHSVVTLNDGSEGIVKDSCEYNKECALKTMPSEFKVGYPGHTITKWRDRRGELYDPGSSKDFTNKMVSDKLELFANWKNNEFIFNYDGNNATSGSMSPSHHTYQDGSSLTRNDYIRTGYTYQNWKDLQTGREYADMEPVSDNTFDDGTNITLTAQWTANKYKVDFDANGGANLSFADKTVTFDSAYGELPTVDRVGYIFKGWWTLASGGTEVTTTTIVNTANDHRLYAHWEARKFTVTFNANEGGTPNPTKKTVTYDDTYGALAVSTRTGYKLLGWYTLSEDGTKIETTTKVSILEDQTLYAHWKYLCESGYTYKTSDKKCHYTYNATKSCPKNYTDTGSNCKKTNTYDAYVTGYSGGCDWDADGGHMSTSNNQQGCIYKSALPECNADTNGDKYKVHDCGEGKHGKIKASGKGYDCSNNNGDRYTYKEYTCICSGSAVYGCDAGDTKKNNKCTHTVTKAYTYKCPDGGTLSGTKCEIVKNPLT